MKRFVGILAKAVFILFLLICLLAIIPIRVNAVSHLILSPVEKKSATTLQFKTSRIWLPGNILLKDVSASNKSGILCHAEAIEIKYNIAAILFGKNNISVLAKGVNFHEDIGLLNSLSRVLTMPKMANVDFNLIEGDFDFQKDAICIKKIAAVNDNIAIKGAGWVKKDGNLDCSVHFSFSKAIVDTIPGLVKATLLSDENNGWMGITLKTTGNYAKPSLHIDSEMFKLNIKETIIKVK